MKHLRVLFAFAITLVGLMARAQTAYVGNYGDSSVTVIDVATSKVIDTIYLGDIPFGVSVSQDGNRVYITTIGTKLIGINTSDNTIAGSIQILNSSVFYVSVSPDGAKIYADGNGSTAAIIDSNFTISARLAVANYPSCMCLSPDGSKLYIASGYSGINTIYVVNAITNTVLDSIAVTACPSEMTISPDGSKLYAAFSCDNAVSVINTVTKTVIDSIKVGADPACITITPDGKKVYVTNELDNTVSVINTATNIVIDTIKVGNAPVGISVSPDGNKVYVANQNDNSVNIISTATDAVIDTIAVGKRPFAFGNFISTYKVVGIPSYSINAVSISIYPNPFTSQATIGFSEEQKNTAITIIDLLGREIETIEFTGKQLTVERGEMSKGMYIVRIATDKKNVVNKKIVIQ